MDEREREGEGGESLRGVEMAGGGTLDMHRRCEPQRTWARRPTGRVPPDRHAHHGEAGARKAAGSHGRCGCVRYLGEDDRDVSLSSRHGVGLSVQLSQLLLDGAKGAAVGRVVWFGESASRGTKRAAPGAVGEGVRVLL